MTHIHKEKKMSDFTKEFEKFADIMKGAVPVIKANKNGYEIRTKVLDMAQNQVWQDFHAKWGTWETSMKKEGSEVVTTINMPEVPGADKVIETAQKFYDFVSGNKNKD